MSIPVSVRAVVSEIDVPIGEWQAFINKSTGDLATLSEQEMALAEGEEDGDDWDVSQQAIDRAVEVLGSSEWVPLPDRSDINEWGIIKRFCLSIEDEALRDRMLQSIRGRKGFRAFKTAVEKSRITDLWHRFRQAELAAVAVEFLEARGIPYIGDHLDPDQSQR